MTRKRKKTRSYKNYIILLVVVILLGALMLFVWTPDDVKFTIQYPVELTVASSRTVGIGVWDDRLGFGKVPLGGSSKSGFSVYHNESEPLFIHINITGNVTPFVTISDNNFWLEPDVEKKITAVADVPSNSTSGFYNGTLTIYFKRSES